MKFTVTFKDPDRLSDAIERAVSVDVAALNLPADEAETIAEKRREKVGEICATWFEWGEYLRVEVDTEAKTCTVLPAKVER